MNYRSSQSLLFASLAILTFLSSAAYGDSRSHRSKPRAGLPIVVVGSGKLSFQGRPLDATSSDPWLLSPLAARVEKWRAASRSLRRRGELGRVILHADGGERFGDLKRAVYTLYEAGVDDIEYAIPGRDPAFRRVRFTGQSGAPFVLGAPFEVAPADPGVDAALVHGEETPTGSTKAPTTTGIVTLRIQREGVDLLGVGPQPVRVGDIDGSLDEARLVEMLASARPGAFPSLAISVADDASWRRVLLAMNAALVAGFADFGLDVGPEAEGGVRPAGTAVATR